MRGVAQATLNRSPSASGIALATVGTGFLLLAGIAAAMPPPGPGNTRGLPASVREALRRTPGLFYPKNGFRDVIDRQKAERAAGRYAAAWDRADDRGAPGRGGIYFPHLSAGGNRLTRKITLVE